MTNEDKNQEIPEMNIDNKYDSKKLPETPSNGQKEMEKIKKEFEKLKNFITKKYPFTQAIGLLPQQSIPKFVEEEEVPKETEKYHHLFVIVPEEKYKEITKIKQEIVKQTENLNEKTWIQVKTPVDVWEYCLDSKFELTSAIAMSFPLHDKGILGALRVAEIHRSLVLQKFEKYVVSYVIGGSLVRGEAKKTSDVDVFIIINDTDVKKMPRLELKERLRSIIYSYVMEASSYAGVKNKLEPQIYLLTEFWESVKDAHPVMFTFIRDGIPIYDRGTFMPWKALLKMGKLKPSPEAIDMFMSLGDNTLKRAKKGLLDIVIQDIYWGVTTPSQALLMLNGSPPPAPKHLVKEMTKEFYTKEKMLEKKYINILDKIVKIYKDYEHEKIKEIKGAEVDKLIRDTGDYLKRLKELREQIEKRTQEKTIEQLHKDVFDLLKSVIGKKSQEKIIEEFEKNYVKKGKFSQQHLRILKNLVKAKSEFKKGKLDSHKINEARKNTSILINDLIEFTQRCELVSLRGKMKLKYTKDGKEQSAELYVGDNVAFLIEKNNVKRITNKIQDSSMEEFSKYSEKLKQEPTRKIKPEVFELVKKELGNFEIVL